MATTMVKAPDAPKLPPRVRFPLLSIPDPNFPKVKSTLELLDGRFLDDTERKQLSQSPVGEEISYIRHTCKAYQSKMETALKSWENAQQASYDAPLDAKSMINQKKGQYAINHREYKSCLMSAKCREQLEYYQRCWDVQGHEVVTEISQTGKFSHESVCRTEKQAIERCMGQFASKAIRLVAGKRDDLF